MTGTQPGQPSESDTVVGLLAEFAADGFDANFGITDDGTIRCPACRCEHDPATIRLERLRRLEGASDPADMVAVLGLACPTCDTRGAAVAKFGPDSSPGEVAVLRAVENHRH